MLHQIRLQCGVILASLMAFVAVLALTPNRASAAHFDSFGSVLLPGNEIPAVGNSAASGSAFLGIFTENTPTRRINDFFWSINFRNLSGPLVAAHIHAQPPGTEPGSANGPVIIDLINDPGAARGGRPSRVLGTGVTTGRLFGSTRLSDNMADALFKGNALNNLWYINLHTELNPSGEIRGQVIIPLPPALFMAFTGLLSLLLVGRLQKRSQGFRVSAKQR